MLLPPPRSIGARVARRIVQALLTVDVYQGIKEVHSKVRARSEFGVSGNELARLLKAPRFREVPFHLLGKQITLTDALGGWQCIQELLIDQIYRFRSSQPNPRILDCGANVGLSVIYFKHLYPEANIVTFEPDPHIFGVLERNVREFGFSDVELRREAVWKENGELSFVADGGFGGRALEPGTETNHFLVKAVRLRDFLSEPTSLLKIDIEGAETAVIKDCWEHLANVEHLFVEYHGRLDEPQHLSEMLEHIRAAGFRYYIKEAAPVRCPFVFESLPSDLYDLQLNIFCRRL